MIQVSETEFELMKAVVDAACEWAADQTSVTRDVLLDEEAVARRPIFRKQSNLLRAVMTFEASEVR